MITWKLNEVMAARRMTGKALAEFVDAHPNTISRLRKESRMPSIDGEMLNRLCSALNCHPNDLIEYTPDTDDKQSYQSSESISPNRDIIIQAARKAAEVIGSSDPLVTKRVALSIVETIFDAEFPQGKQASTSAKGS